MGVITKKAIITNFGGGKILLESLGINGLNIKEQVDVDISLLPDGSNILIDCKCDSCGKYFKRQINSIRRSNSKHIYCKKCSYKLVGDKLTGTYKQSFYDWCIENNKRDFLDRWDKELNLESPKEVSCVSRKLYYFKCPSGLHKSEGHTLANVIRMYNIICSICNSFAFWCIVNVDNDFLNKYWDYNKNAVSPFNILSASKSTVWIRCQENRLHQSYEVKCYNFKRGNRCPYCHGRKVAKCDSFAQYINNLYGTDALKLYWDYEKNKIDPWELARSCITKVWIKCQKHEYHGSYLISTNKFSRGDRCSYCKGTRVHPLDSLANVYPNILNVWSNQNNISPEKYLPKSNQSVLWKCPTGIHSDYNRKISDSVYYEFRCPECSRIKNESFLQEKVRTYIENMKCFTLQHEYNCSIIPQNPKHCSGQYKMPFDNEIVELKLIIEVHGRQHYEITGFHYLSARHYKTTPEEEFHKQKLYDRYKKYVAFCNGYFYLAIPYWTEHDEYYKQLIDNKISEILSLSNVV